jgi:hypothetical protein
MSEKPFPPVPPELLATLEQLFPDRMPATSLSHDEIREAMGAVKVVRLLRLKFEEQSENILEQPM